MGFLDKLNAVQINHFGLLCEEDKSAISEINSHFEFRLKYLAKFEEIRANAEKELTEIKKEAQSHFTKLYFGVGCDSFGSISINLIRFNCTMLA